MKIIRIDKPGNYNIDEPTIILNPHRYASYSKNIIDLNGVSDISYNPRYLTIMMVNTLDNRFIIFGEAQAPPNRILYAKNYVGFQHPYNPYPSP